MNASVAAEAVPVREIHNRMVGYAPRMGATLTVISERQRHAGGCSTPLVQPDLSGDEAIGLALVTKALADPTRLRIVDALRKASPEAVCQCELLPLFEMSQPALAKHLKVLTAVGILSSERRGLWAFYCLNDDALDDLRRWLS
jgi:ArsR family transcriptional regulator, arsenate/arsenite/antimonite-responsive transcriptional repressor